MTTSSATTIQDPHALVVLVDSAANVVEAEGDALARLVLDPASDVGRPISEALRPYPPLVEGLKKALAGETTAAEVVVDGSVLGVRFVPRAAKAGGGAAMLAFEKAAELRGALAADAWNRVRRRLVAIPIALWTTDLARRISFAMGSLPGRIDPGTSPVGRTVDEVVGAEVAADPAVAHHLAALQGEEQSFRYPYVGRLLDVRISPIRDDAGTIIGTAGAAVDVTDLARAESELARRAQLLEQVQQTAHVGSWEWEVTTNVFRASNELCRVYGTAPEHFFETFDGFLERVHPGDVARVRDAFFRAIERREAISIDHRIIRPDGEIRMIHTRGEIVAHPDSQLRMVGSSWDVTERWEAEAKLARSASILGATLESTTDGLLIVDLEGTIVKYNARFLAMWNMPAELMRTADDPTAISVAADQLEDPEAFVLRIRELYHDTEAVGVDLIWLKDGRVFERYTQPQRLADRIVGRIWSFRDVTEREWMMRRAMFLSDMSSLIGSLDVESALDAVAHLAVRSLADSCAIDFLSTEDGPRRLLAVARSSVAPIPTELPRAIMVGHAVIESNQAGSRIAAPLTWGGKVRGVITFALERGARRYGEEDLVFAKEVARRVSLAVENARLYKNTTEALHARDEFLSTAAHEIRGPLTGIHLAAQQLARTARLPAKSTNALSIILREDRRLSRFVDELLDVTRIRTGLLHFDLSDVDLGQVVRDVVARFGSELARSGSSITIEADEHVVGRWDRSGIDRIVTNLVSNAIKFGAANPIAVRVSMSSGSAKLLVEDHGLGIPPERQTSIFDPFERAVSSRHYGGLGLGLFVVRRLAEGMGGSVKVKSEIEHGSTFMVELPLSSGWT